MKALVDIAAALSKHLPGGAESPQVRGILAGVMEEARERVGGRTFYIRKGKAARELEDLRSIVVKRLRFAGIEMPRAQAIASGVVEELQDVWRGQIVYIALGRLVKVKRRNELIWAEAESGITDVRAIADRHHLTPRQVQKILAAKRAGKPNTTET